MNLIAAADQNWGIGHHGRLLCHLPADLRRFKELTTGKIVVMGRCTLQSLPEGRALVGRRNIVLSRGSFAAADCLVVDSLQQLLKMLSLYDSDDIFVIGGASLYRELLPYCGRAYITRLAATFPADRHLPDLDQLPGWQLVDSSAPLCHEGLRFNYCLYENSQPRPLPTRP
jgi:dihydrofolate reductase